MEKRPIDGRSALGEVVLIVLGILIALAIDSYVGRRAERAQARAYLEDLVVELRADSIASVDGARRLESLIESASRVLDALQPGGAAGQEIDVARELIGALFGEAVTSEPVVWEELQATGSLRLISDPDTRTAIVAHYLDRASRFRIIDGNFTPAIRDLRALAWDILPVEGFFGYFRGEGVNVPPDVVVRELTAREDAEFLLKRAIITASVARRNLEGLAQSTGDLIARLSE